MKRLKRNGNKRVFDTDIFNKRAKEISEYISQKYNA